MSKKSTLVLGVSAALAAIAACHSGEDAPAPSTAPLEGTTAPLPSEISPPAVYVAKVKNVLVGLPPTDEEVKAVVADPGALAGLIDGWMKLPQYETKMLRFFQLAFQQTQIAENDFDDQTFPNKANNNRVTGSVMAQNLTESFARTVFALVSAGRPLTDAMTTRSFMMTPALMEFYAFLDAWQIDDAGKVTDRFLEANPGITEIVATSTKIPFAESVDPTSASFMRFTVPNLAALDAKEPGCFTDPVVVARGQGGKPQLGIALQRILQGGLDGRKNPNGGAACGPVAGQVAGPIGGDDFTTWKMVTTRAPKGKERTTDFWDLPKLRASGELVLQIPRVGFFSTPAFFANWQTNISNQMRVTVNQALIVGLGAAVDGTDPTHPPTTPGLDAAHAGQPACFSCHQTLDPTRAIFASAFSWNYHNQTEGPFAREPGMFQFRGLTKAVTSLDDFGNVLATHPLFAQAWTQKLCFYANSRQCDASDPELQRIVGVFEGANLSWNVLVRELLASPITTNAKNTKTLSDQGEIVAVARRDHWCAALNVRLGFDDVCGLKSTAVEKGTKTIASVSQIVSGLPSDGYGRGSVAPVLPNDPSLFYRAGAENVCASIAELVVDPQPAKFPGAKVWLSARSEAAIPELVSLLMALTPSDPRYAQAVDALVAHHAAALQTGASASDALKSTFVVACLAPSAISIGL